MTLIDKGISKSLIKPSLSLKATRLLSLQTIPTCTAIHD